MEKYILAREGIRDYDYYLIDREIADWVNMLTERLPEWAETKILEEHRWHGDINDYYTSLERNPPARAAELYLFIEEEMRPQSLSELIDFVQQDNITIIGESHEVII